MNEKPSHEEPKVHFEAGTAEDKTYKEGCVFPALLSVYIAVYQRQGIVDCPLAHTYDPRCMGT